MYLIMNGLILQLPILLRDLLINLHFYTKLYVNLYCPKVTPTALLYKYASDAQCTPWWHANIILSLHSIYSFVTQLTFRPATSYFSCGWLMA
jgi:hypothetical protein